ncbi:MAG: sulfate adenylyltransferase subunit CysD [Bacteroidetes bacterium]|nr:sulfate adenylyltransferase subunit CysD [Bacteroidota bacterium]
MQTYYMNHIRELESESIFVIREVAAQFDNPVLLFSGGKDSIIMLHLAVKAFRPAIMPFTILHIDTGHNFPETLEYRDNLMKKLGLKLVVGSVQKSIDDGRAFSEQGPNQSRNVLQSVTLLDTIAEYGFDCALGGGRRDEEKARAKERFFSHRDDFGQWDPKNQRPELWNLFNGRKRKGEHFRVFPLSNWTELDIWQYAMLENIEMPVLYYTHKRECVRRNGVILAKSDYISLLDGEEWENLQIRFRTIGDMSCTGASISDANTLEEIILEVAASRITERGGRADDKTSETSMEDRKKEGYF